MHEERKICTEQSLAHKRMCFCNNEAFRTFPQFKNYFFDFTPVLGNLKKFEIQVSF
jgi:hypothetical protein